MDMPDVFFTLVRKDDRLGGGLLAMVMRYISPMDIPISEAFRRHDIRLEERESLEDENPSNGAASEDEKQDI